MDSQVIDQNGMAAHGSDRAPTGLWILVSACFLLRGFGCLLLELGLRSQKNLRYLHVGHANRIPLVLGQAAMALTPEEKQAWVDSHVSADLKFIFNECGLDGDLQYVSQFYKTTMRFGAIADSRGGLREAMQQDFQVAVDTPAGRARMSAAVSAWETAKQVSDKDIKLRTESKNLGICRPHRTDQQ